MTRFGIGAETGQDQRPVALTPVAAADLTLQVM